jgi:hypothetical protein
MKNRPFVHVVCPMQLTGSEQMDHGASSVVDP